MSFILDGILPILRGMSAVLLRMGRVLHYPIPEYFYKTFGKVENFANGGFMVALGTSETLALAGFRNKSLKLS